MSEEALLVVHASMFHCCPQRSNMALVIDDATTEEQLRLLEAIMNNTNAVGMYPNGVTLWARGRPYVVMTSATSAPTLFGAGAAAAKETSRASAVDGACQRQ